MKTNRMRRACIERVTQLILAGILSLVPAKLYSQANPVIGSTRTIELSDLYRQLDNAPRVAAAVAMADAASARISSSKRPPDPTLQLGFMNRSIPSLAPMDPLGMTQLQLMQMIPTPGKLALAGRIASASAAAARNRADDVRWELRARVAMTFYELRTSTEQITIARNTRVLLQDIAKVSRTMYSVGAGTQADPLKAQVEAARMDDEIIRMESMRSSMYAELASLIGRDIDTLATPRISNLPDALPPLETTIQEALVNRPMLQASRRELDAAASSARLARKEIWPDLEVGLQYGWRGMPEGTERMGSLMLGASLPIYARSRQLQMRREAESMRIAAAAEVAATSAETRARVIALYSEFNRSRQLIDLYRTTILPQAEAATAASLSAYRVGSVNLMTLLDNQMSVNRIREGLVKLESDQGKAIAELEMLVGRELTSIAGDARTLQ
jgi:cobalt-zinc-cadmium efflux system outer membrane protein